MIDIRAAKTTCQVCKKEKKDTRTRYVKNPGYEGPCGDSFCYASCDMDSCVTREFNLFACDGCAKKFEAQVAKDEKKAQERLAKAAAKKK